MVGGRGGVPRFAKRKMGEGTPKDQAGHVEVGSSDGDGERLGQGYRLKFRFYSYDNWEDVFFANESPFRAVKEEVG